MPIGISDEHTELAASVRKWAESQGSIAAIRAAETDSEALAPWGALAAELGLSAIALPESAGGGGGTLLDQAVAIEAAGYALVPGPLLTTAVAGLMYDDAELRAGIADGSITVGLGTSALAVVEAGRATHLSVPVAAGHVAVPVDQAEVRPGASVDLSRGVGEVVLGDVPNTDLPTYPKSGAPLELIVLAAAEASGIARWCLDTAVEYAKVREQFGQKIGAFQAVKHLCAEMLEISESVTAAAWDAAEAAEHGEEQALFAAGVAATICFDGAVEVAKSCIQVLGGIGFTYEHDAHFYLRRAIALRALVGDTGEAAAALSACARTGVRRSGEIDFGGLDEQFRADARAEAQRIAGLADDDRRAALAANGYLAPHWPAPYGLGAGPVQQLVIDQELQSADVERPDLVIGAWAAPTILEGGTDEQRERFIGPTLTGEITWCQLFSEPGAGSDLASLRMKAERTDGGWLLTGQKVWNSIAERADWGVCLARTDADAKPHAGISYFVVDMKSAGIDIRPLRELTGEALFNEVFFDNVFVPDDCVVGEINKGWRLAVTTLANERVAMAGSKLGDSVELAITLLDETRSPAAPEKVGRAIALAQVVKLLGTRSTLRSIAGQGPGAESSVAKLVGVRSRQDSAELAMELLGPEMFTRSERALAANDLFLRNRCLSIAGGTTQILRNVAGERILGLPRA
ncbi:acyl-CoA dehydrogenase [Nocardioides marmoriginsengisoli]|uniref:Acyl-CoA dehydrogenase n=1 Tax=Nocardioides marmoriginsengisoli TaxID=661483 RepID=A0A3N0CN80_9ACTN|nr:acyl-CoA dehydrogenase [Nocardioides marmoriginsengisoli]RNL64800.1 acyl-CoA dehydrogenase [Nocardioides marmoriginsengisoli]